MTATLQLLLIAVVVQQRRVMRFMNYTLAQQATLITRLTNSMTKLGQNQELFRRWIEVEHPEIAQREEEKSDIRT